VHLRTSNPLESIFRGGEAQDRCDQANEASRQRAVPGVQDRQKDQPMLEVVKRRSELDESGAGGSRIQG